MENNVQFNEPQYATPASQAAPKQSFLTKLVIATGLAKDEASAQKALIGVLVAVLALTAWVVFSQFSGGGSEVPPPPPGTEVMPMP